jgi:hypothetical protein
MSACMCKTQTKRRVLHACGQKIKRSVFTCLRNSRGKKCFACIYTEIKRRDVFRMHVWVDENKDKSVTRTCRLHGKQVNRSVSYAWVRKN